MQCDLLRCRVQVGERLATLADHAGGWAHGSHGAGCGDAVGAAAGFRAPSSEPPSCALPSALCPSAPGPGALPCPPTLGCIWRLTLVRVVPTPDDPEANGPSGPVVQWYSGTSSPGSVAGLAAPGPWVLTPRRSPLAARWRVAGLGVGAEGLSIYIYIYTYVHMYYVLCTMYYVQ